MTAGLKSVATLLREIVYYYHIQGRSKHKLSITETISQDYQRTGTDPWKSLTTST